MSVHDIKNKIQELIDRQDDPEILDQVRSLLEEANRKESVLREKLESRALKSEEDIKTGRVFTLDQVRTMMKERIHKS